MPEIKPGKTTSEFYLTCVFIGVVILNGTEFLNLSQMDIALIGGVCGVYGLSRGVAKSGGAQTPKETIVWKEKE